MFVLVHQIRNTYNDSFSYFKVAGLFKTYEAAISFMEARLNCMSTDYNNSQIKKFNQYHIEQVAVYE